MCGRSQAFFSSPLFLVRQKRPSWGKLLLPPPGWQSIGLSPGWEIELFFSSSSLTALEYLPPKRDFCKTAYGSTFVCHQTILSQWQNGDLISQWKLHPFVSQFDHQDRLEINNDSREWEENGKKICSKTAVGTWSITSTLWSVCGQWMTHQPLQKVCYYPLRHRILRTLTFFFTTTRARIRYGTWLR